MSGRDEGARLSHQEAMKAGRRCQEASRSIGSAKTLSTAAIVMEMDVVRMAQRAHCAAT